jgi:hypothetical protein
MAACPGIAEFSKGFCGRGCAICSGALCFPSGPQNPLEALSVRLEAKRGAFRPKLSPFSRNGWEGLIFGHGKIAPFPDFVKPAVDKSELGGLCEECDGKPKISVHH